MNKKGFTLIELLIVIGIIAILAAAMIIAINPGRQFEQARNATRWSHMNSIMNAVYSYAITQEGNYPDCIPDYGDVVDLYMCYQELVEEDGGFISTLPKDPQVGGTNYTWDCNEEAWCGGVGVTDLTCVGALTPEQTPTQQDCTGYVIGFASDSQNRLKLIPAASEASDMQIIQ